MSFLLQWAGEVISSKDKPVVADEFRDLENDIELRKEGANRSVNLRAIRGTVADMSG